MTRLRMLKGVATAAAAFVALGTVSALWDNPLFVRMTPSGDLEIVLLALLALLLGVYVAVRRPQCSFGTAGAGGVLGFLGVACPVCNQVLLAVFGGELLLTYFEPIRLYVGAAGAIMVAAMVALELRQHYLARRASALGVA